MIKKLDTTHFHTQQEIVDLQKASYAIEAKLIGYDQIPPLLDDENSISMAKEIFYGYYSSGELIALISFTYENEVLDIHRLAISPEHFHKGIASQLLSWLENWEDPVCKIIVSTGRDNVPAICLYQKMAYVKVAELQVEEGLWLCQFEKALKN